MWFNIIPIICDIFFNSILTMFVCGLKAQWLIHIQLCSQRAVLHLTWLYCGVNRVLFDNFCLLTDCLVIINNSLIKNHLSTVCVSTLKCNCSFYMNDSRQCPIIETQSQCKACIQNIVLCLVCLCILIYAMLHFTKSILTPN